MDCGVWSKTGVVPQVIESVKSVPPMNCSNAPTSTLAMLTERASASPVGGSREQVNSGPNGAQDVDVPGVDAGMLYCRLFEGPETESEQLDVSAVAGSAKT